MSDLVRLADCPPGLFRYGTMLGFRSEYSTVTKSNANHPDAYVVASGEYFWGGCTTSEDRSDLMVEPLSTVPPAKRVGELITEALALAPMAGLYLEITVKEAGAK